MQASTGMHTNTNWVVVYVFPSYPFTFEQFCFVFLSCLLCFHVWFMSVQRVCSVSSPSTVWCWIIVCDYRCRGKSFGVRSQKSALRPVARPWSQDGHMRSWPAWGEAELQTNCPLCCCRDDTRRELRDQAYAHTKKVKQTKKIIDPQTHPLARSLNLSFCISLCSLHTMTLKSWVIFSLFLLQ